MELKIDSVGANDDERGFGFVSGIVDKPITPTERANGFIGHTVDEWEGYNKLAGRYPLKNNHGEVVGRILHTYVDNRGNLCASAMLDPKHATLWEDVRAGRINSFSIGFNADPNEAGGVPYKNNDFEVSLTSTPRLPFASIKVRCSKMADATPVPVPVPVPAPAAAAPAVVETPAAPSSAASAPPMDGTNAEMLRKMEEMSHKAAQWEAHLQAERERVYKENMAKVQAVLPALGSAGMDIDNEGNKAIFETLARVPETTPLLSAFEKLAASHAALRAQSEAAMAAAAQEKARADAEAATRQQSMSFLDALRMQFGGTTANAAPATSEPKRQVTSQAWNSTPPAAMSPADALRAGLGAIDPSLFQAAAARAHAASAAQQPAIPTPQQVAAATQQQEADGAIDMPPTPEARLAMMYMLHQHRVPMSTAVRCSAETEQAAIRRVQDLARSNPESFAARHIHMFTPAFSEAMFGDEEYWRGRSNEFTANGRLLGWSLAPTRKEMMIKFDSMHRPAWDNSLQYIDPLPTPTN